MMIGSRVQDILLFLAVVDAGSFVAGGKAFGLSRSTAGKAIARLEKTYGVRLLNRSTRSLSLTNDGRLLYEKGRAIRASIEAADASIGGVEGVPTGTLRITAPDALGRKLLLPAIQRYLHRWPKVRCDVSFSDSPSRMIEEGYDLAIRVGVRSPDQGLIARTIAREDAVLCAAPSYLEDRAPPNSIEQLSTHMLLQFASGNDRQGWHMREPSRPWVTAQGQVRLRMDSAEGLRDAAIAGMGIVMLPRSLVQDDINTGRLVRVLPRVDCGTVPILVLYPHKRFLEPRVRNFIDMLDQDLKRTTATKGSAQRFT